MAEFKIVKDETGKHIWKAVETNPSTEKLVVIRGGQAGTPDGNENPKSEQSFDARHEAQRPMTPKKYINRLRWDDKAKRYTLVDIPNKLFKED